MLFAEFQWELRGGSSLSISEGGWVMSGSTVDYICKLIEDEQRGIEADCKKLDSLQDGSTEGREFSPTSSLFSYYGVRVLTRVLSRIIEHEKVPGTRRIKLNPSAAFSGAYFDRFEGEPDPNPDQFLAEDVLAVSLLSAPIPPRAIQALLYDESSRFNDMLAEIPKNLDFFEANISHLELAMNLETALMLPKSNYVGPVRASKLIARKRPQLYPIFDSVVMRQLLRKRNGAFILPLHKLLTEDPKIKASVMNGLSEVRAAAHLPESLSLIRVLDVLVWMDGEGKQQALGSSYVSEL